MAERLVVGKIFSSRLFKYDPAQKRFTASIKQTPEVLRQLWVDSLDLGFGIRSERSGQVVFFTLESADRDESGLYKSWAFRVYNPSSDPRLSGLLVLIFNV